MERTELSQRSLASIDTDGGFDLIWIDGSKSAEGKKLVKEAKTANCRLVEKHYDVRGGPDAAIRYGLEKLLALGYDYCGLIENDIEFKPGWFKKLMATFELAKKQGLEAGAATARTLGSRVLECRGGFTINWNMGAGMVLFTSEAARQILADYGHMSSREIAEFYRDRLGFDLKDVWELWMDKPDRPLGCDWKYAASLYKVNKVSVGTLPSMATNIDADIESDCRTKYMTRRSAEHDKPRIKTSPAAAGLAKPDAKSTIIIDGVIFDLQRGRPHGISRVWSRLLEQLAKTPLAGQIVLLDRAGSAPVIPGIRRRPAPPCNFQDTEADSLQAQGWCDQENAALFISTYYTYAAKTPTVIMLHDLIPEFTGQDLSQPEWLAKERAIRQAAGYFAVSQSTANDFRRFHPQHAQRKVHLTPNAVGDDFRRAAAPEIGAFRDRHGIRKPYFLLVGHRALYKNAGLFFRAFALLPDRREFEIVCAGGAAELETAFRPFVADVPCHILQISDQELSAAYSGAVALVYPSRYEGFGLPILEAQKCGCPVITCRNSSIPEVAGETVCYVDESDVAVMKQALLDIRQPGTRQRLIEAGQRNAARFSWAKTAGVIAQAISEFRVPAASGLPKVAQDCLDHAEAYFKKGKLAEARVWLKRMLDITPNEFEPLMALGNLSFQLGDMTAAAAAFARAAQQRPEDAAVQVLLATASVQSGQTDYFEKALARAFELDPTNLPGLQLLARLNLEQGRLADAAKTYHKILQQDENNVAASLGLGVCFFKQGNRDMAQKSFERVLKLQPNHPVALENLRVMQAPASSAPPKAAAPPVASPPPLVSAIVSTYNSERFMRGCLEDLTSQTLFASGQLEIIVVDAGSPQDERAIVAEFQQRFPNIIYRRTEERETIYAAWNRGVQAARGRYLTNANTDDRHRPDALAVMAAHLEAHPEIALVYADQLVSDVPNETFAETHAASRWNWPEYSYAELERRCIVGPQPMWRRSLHGRHGLFLPELRSAGDYEFWLRIGKEENFQRLPDILGIYYRNPGGDELSGGHTARETHEIRQRHGILARNITPCGSVPVPVSKEELNRLPFRETCLPAAGGKPPLVSIILPTYNRPDRLAAALRSVSSQTLTDYEIIVVNDAGSDVEAAVAPLRAQQRIVCLRHEVNKGIAAARNTGLAAARGKYIAYLDDDDVFYPDHLQTLVELLESHPGTVAYTDAHCAFQEKVNGQWATIRREVVWSQDWDNDKILVDNFVPTLCIMHERACLEKTGKFDESLGRHEDWDLWIRLSRHFAFAHIPKITCEFERRQDKSSLTIQGFAPFLKTMTRIHARYAGFVQGRPDLLKAQLVKRAELRRLAHGQAGGAKLKVGILSLEENQTACAWLRLGSPLNFLRAQGLVERLPLCELADGRVTINAEKIPQAQLIVVQRSMPFCLPWHVLRAAVKDPSVRIIFELDDALTQVPDTNPHFGHFQTIRPQIEAYLRNADLVTVSTPQLKKIYSCYNDHIEVLPNTLDAQIWLPLPPKARSKGKVTILFSGTLTHQHDLAIIERAIDLIILEFGAGVEFLFWGNLPASLRDRPQVKSIAAFTPDYRQYVEQLKTLAVDLALVPLEVVPFNQAKSDIKWLEYSACKIPAIFTDIEAYNQSVEHGKTGWLTANTVEAWHGAMKKLILDKGLRQSMAENAHQTVLAQRSLEANADLWLQAYETALASPPKTSCGETPGTPETSIIIPTFNKLDLTRNCLLALQKNTPAGDYEIIVVDNASTDGTVEFLKNEEQAGRLRAVLNSENAGFARACNQGACAARGKYILFLNNDTEVHPGWLAPLVALANADPAVAAVGAKLLYPDGKIQHAGVALADCSGHDPLLAFHLFAKEKADIAPANERRIYQAVTAACMLARKSHFDAAGGFDEEYWNGYEDVDLCLRFQERGWLTVYEPASVVTHHESQSGPERFRRAAENVQRFHRKWLEKASPDFIIDKDGNRPAQTAILRPYAPLSAKLVSILILAHNQLRDTRQCVASIEKHTAPPHELILIDNGSTDGTGQFFRDYATQHSHVRVILNHANLGFSAGNNQGLACARGDFILLLNNDTVVTPGWLERMLAALERHPDCGLVGPVSNSVSGPQRVAVNYSNLDRLDNFAAQWRAAHAGQSAETARLVGFCLLLRRAVLEKIGGLDARFGSGNFEDDDFCLRAALAGFKLRMVLDAFVHHTGGQTFKGAGIDYRASLKQNWELFKAKWCLPKDAAMEKGYHAPSAAPQGLVLRLPLPELKDSHTPALEGRCWTDKTLRAAAPAKAAPKQVVITLPPCALIGDLKEARDLLDKKKFKAVKDRACAAIQARPFHPEAWLLLGRVAQAAGDAAGARLCAERAARQAPNWEPPKQFLKTIPGKSSKPGWLVLPPALAEKPDRAPRLSVCLIVKNEEQFLEQCLQSIRDVAHQIVVVDTGSTDRTVEIAKKFKAEVYFFPWRDDFSAARNEALKHVTGDWVLTMDADEELVREHKRTILEEMQTPEVIGYRLPISNHGRAEEGCGYVPRLCRNAPGLFFVGRVHEQIFSALETRGKEWGLENRLGRTALLHHGYSEGVVVSRDKIARNLRLLRLAVEELPGEPNLIMNLGLELIRSGEREAGLEKYREALDLVSELPPGGITPEFCESLLTQLTSNLLGVERFSEIVDLWQQPFPKSREKTASQHLMLGLCYLKLENPAAAAEEMRQCLAKRSQPALSTIHKEIHTVIPRHSLALSLAALGQRAGAEETFREALGEDAKSRPLRFDFARFQLQQGHPLEALKLANELVAENRQDIPVWQLGGEAALSQPEFLEFARDWTGEAMRNHPEDSVILLQRAEALLLNQAADLALPLWLRAHSPKSPRHLAALTLCELLAGRCRRSFAPATEKSVSQEFVKWYRHLIRCKARSLVHQLNEKLEELRAVLPAAAGVLDAAMKQAGTALAVS
jgi:GT2 family glycosyltransferase/glycosyltransferase involved in cell wall biosynthesis/Tfp pilus assembly protein PilF